MGNNKLKYLLYRSPNLKENELENIGQDAVQDIESIMDDVRSDGSAEEPLPGEVNPETSFELDEEPETPEKREKKHFTSTLLYKTGIKVAAFLLATAMLCLVGGLCVEYVLVKGPSDTLSREFVLTMLETRRFGFMAGIFLTDEELAAAQAVHYQVYEESTDASLITVQAPEETDAAEAPVPDGTVPGADAYGIVDEDGDGIVIEELHRNGYTGYMMIVYDPFRVQVALTDIYGEVGQNLSTLCRRTNAVAGINAGGFADENGVGLGGMPLGLTVVNGTYYNTDADPAYFIGFDGAGILHVGYYSVNDVYNLNIVNGVTFGPTLVVNGEARSAEALSSGLNPRTAIGQRADGAVLMLVIDGRQVHSFGATYLDLAETMVEYGAVNAANLDGGSSSGMWFDGEMVNSGSAYGGDRSLPTAFVVRREG